MDYCLADGCKKKPKVICYCADIILCSNHIASHLLLPGNHQINNIHLVPEQNSKDYLIEKYLKFIEQLDELLIDVNKKGGEIINDLHMQLTKAYKVIYDLRRNSFQAISVISTLHKIKIYSQNPYEKLLLKPLSELKATESYWKLPRIDLSIPSNLINLKPLDNEYPSDPIDCSLIAILSELNSKTKLSQYAESICSNPNTQLSLLNIVLNTRKDPSTKSIAGRALTILSSLSFDFSNLNLQNICIYGAEITKGNFTNTILTGSAFSSSKIDRSLFKDAIIDSSMLESIYNKKERLEGHSLDVTIVRFLMNGKHLVSGSLDCSIRVWECRTGFCSVVLEGHSSAISDLDISHDSSKLLSLSTDGLVKLWDLSTETCTLSLSDQPAKFIHFSEDSSLLITILLDNSIAIHYASGEYHSKFANNGEITCIDIPAYKIEGCVSVAYGQADGAIKLWIAGGKRPLWNELSRHSSKVTSICSVKMGKYTLTGHEVGLVKIWGSKLATRRVSRSISKHITFLTEIQMFDSEVPRIFSRRLNFISCDQSGNIKITDSKTNELVFTKDSVGLTFNTVDLNYNLSQIATADSNIIHLSCFTDT